MEESSDCEEEDTFMSTTDPLSKAIDQGKTPHNLRKQTKNPVNNYRREDKNTDEETRAPERRHLSRSIAIMASSQPLTPNPSQRSIVSSELFTSNMHGALQISSERAASAEASQKIAEIPTRQCKYNQSATKSLLILTSQGD